MHRSFSLKYKWKGDAKVHVHTKFDMGQKSTQGDEKLNHSYLSANSHFFLLLGNMMLCTFLIKPFLKKNQIHLFGD